MQTIGELLTLSHAFVKEKNPSVIKKDVELLFAHILGMPRLDLFCNFEKPVKEEEKKALRDGLKRLIMNEPLAYIEGKVSFSHLELFVDMSVLIPREETEELVSRVTHFFKEKGITSGKVLDLCSGSGAIGLSIKKEFPEMEVSLLDISRDALGVAKKNATLNELEVELIQSDLFANVQKREWDFCISNPPYISEEEYNQLDPSVKLYEPRTALVGGVSGYQFYERIAKEYPQYVKKALFLEVGYNQGKRVQQLFGKKASLQKDINGHDRFIELLDVS